MENKICATIKITEEETVLCERYQFETNSLKDIVLKFAGAKTNDIKIDKFKAILNEYVESYAQLMVYINFLNKKYLYNTQYEGYEFNINFDFCELEIYKNEGECKSCQK